MVLAVGAQVALGIATLLLWVPLPLAAAHQAGSVVLLTAVAFAAHAAGSKQA
jgi:cytochrome c oxidase assembly protein subunit 15